MGETIMQVLLHLCVVGVVFGIIISVRNKIEYSNEYESFKKSDGLILMLVSYLLVFFAHMNLENIHMAVDYSLPSYELMSGVNWIPFSWIKDQLELFKFFEYVGRNNYGESYGTMMFLAHYMKLGFHLMPIALLVYVLSTKKWVGFILTEVIAILVLRLSYQFLLGDGIVIIAMEYLLIAIIGHYIRRGISGENFKDTRQRIELIISYTLASLIILFAFVFLMEFNVWSSYEGKLVGTIELDEHYDMFDGLVTLNLTHASLYTGGRIDENIKFNGNLDIDKSLYQYFGEDIYNEVHVTYDHSYYGQGASSGYSSLDFDFIDPEKNNGANFSFQHYLELGNYDNYVKIENEFVKIKDDYSKKFFRLNGISELDLRIKEEDTKSFYEIIDTQVGHDEYTYFEYTYKAYKFEGEVLDLYLNPFKQSKDGEYINFYPFKEEVLEETNEYKLIYVKTYILPREEAETDLENIEMKAYGAVLTIEGNVDEALLEFDKEDFE